jgi:hypothetical protein
MRDIDVRRLLRASLGRAWAKDGSTTIVEELGLCRGYVRVDIAVVNGSLKGYEIKSERDTLARLPSQSAVYNRVFDTMTIVAAARHVAKLETIVPQWWGVEVVTQDGRAGPELSSLRPEGVNPDVDPSALVQLLWREEALALLAEAVDSPEVFAREPRGVIWEALTAAVELSELKDMVRTCLKTRPRWRVDATQRPHGATYLPFAKSSGSLALRVHERSRKYTRRPS